VQPILSDARTDAFAKSFAVTGSTTITRTNVAGPLAVYSVLAVAVASQSSTETVTRQDK
jgi:hypothetical protein